MSTTLTIPENYHYVIAALSSTAIAVWGQVVAVAVYRRRTKIPYPEVYATKEQVEKSPDAFIFNCAQRAHQNSLENLPLLILGTAITGLSYPIPAAAFCAFWSVSRIPYTLGYLSGNPDKRLQRGARFGFIGNLILSFVTAYVAYKRLAAAKF